MADTFSVILSHKTRQGLLWITVDPPAKFSRSTSKSSLLVLLQICHHLLRGICSMNVVVSVTEKNWAESQTILWFAVYQINQICKATWSLTSNFLQGKRANFLCTPEKAHNFVIYYIGKWSVSLRYDNVKWNRHLSDIIQL